MNSLASLKSEIEDFEIEFEVLPSIEELSVIDVRKANNNAAIADIDDRLSDIQDKIDLLNKEIDRLTSHADGLDYTIAVASGIIAGIIDSVWVGEFSLDRANEWGTEKVNNFVVDIAQKQGYKGDDLPGAIRFLEEKYPIAADKATSDFGGGLQHHLRDFSHHPTLVGLFFSLLTQFTGSVYGTDTAGAFKIVPVGKEGITLLGTNLPEKITFGVINWFFHMVSDMAGSSGTIAKGAGGTGLPGPLLSLLKEISALPIFGSLNANGQREFSVWISKLFNGTLLGKRDENGKLIEAVKFDFRTEIGIVNEVGRQAVPVIVNECIVRGFYFIRRLFQEIKNNEVNSLAELNKVEWRNTLPFKNRTIVRMLTISTGTFTAIDLADAAIRTAVGKPGACANPMAFFSTMILRVNFVGVGRFAIAITTDIGMGIKRNKYCKERIVLCKEQIQLIDAKVYYKVSNMWISAEETGKTLEEAYLVMEESIQSYSDAISDICKSVDNINESIDAIVKNTPDFAEKMLDVLDW